MCHSNHETEFGSHVNLITGQNGSMLCFFHFLIAFVLFIYLFIFFLFLIGFYDLLFVEFVIFFVVVCLCQCHIDVTSVGNFM